MLPPTPSRTTLSTPSHLTKNHPTIANTLAAAPKHAFTPSRKSFFEDSFFFVPPYTFLLWRGCLCKNCFIKFNKAVF
eukprot:UN10317